MKITKQQLKQLVKEEIDKELNEMGQVTKISKKIARYMKPKKHIEYDIDRYAKNVYDKSRAGNEVDEMGAQWLRKNPEYTADDALGNAQLMNRLRWEKEAIEFGATREEADLALELMQKAADPKNWKKYFPDDKLTGPGGSRFSHKDALKTARLMSMFKLH